MKKAKRMFSVMLAFFLLVSVLPTGLALAKNGEYSYIRDSSQASGSDYTTNQALAQALDAVFRGDIDIYTSASYKTEKMMPLGEKFSKVSGANISHGKCYYVRSKTTKSPNSLGGQQCYIYAQAVYNKLFHETVYNGSGLIHSSIVISGKGINQLTYSMFKNAGVKCGAYMRTTSNSSGTYKKNDSHSIIILSYGKSTITYLEANAEEGHYIQITTQTWDEFNSDKFFETSTKNKRYLCHIVQPTEKKYESLYPSCSHVWDNKVWDNKGKCTKANCNALFPHENYFDDTHHGTYTVKSGATAILRERPYKYCTAIASKTSGTLTVVGTVQNHYPNTWYKVSYNGGFYYVYGDSLKHTHSYSIVGYETAHPHYQTKTCSCGLSMCMQVTKKVSSCTICNPSSASDSTNPDNYTFPSRTLKYTSPTMKGNDVKWVQAVLYRLGYSIAIDGSYGKNSVAVIKQFQSAYGLEVDGYCGPATRAKLSQLWSAKKNAHTHSYAAATCTKAKTCTTCGATSGSALGHSYTNACDKTCNRCGATRSVSHSYAAATCTKAKTCTVCGVKSGTKTEHRYSNTCDKTCNICGASRSIIHRTYKTVVTKKATLSKNGATAKTCTVCGKVASTSTIKYAKTIKLSTTSYTYNGTKRTPSVIVKDSAGNKISSDYYTVKYDTGRTKAGTYKVTVTMKGRYSGTKTLYFKINPIKISNCKVSLSTTAYTYNGAVRTPSVTVRNQWGTKLTKDIHYTVKYDAGRKNVGTYKVTVTMKGNYSGTKTLYMTILPPKTTMSKVTAGKSKLTVSIAKKTTQVSGYQVQYSTSKKFTNAKTKTISSYKTTSTTLSGLSSKKTYYVRVRTYKTVNGKTYYSGWSEYKTRKTQ